MRLVLLGLTLVLNFTVWFVFRILLLWSDSLTRSWRHLMVRFWSIAAARIIGLHIHVEGIAPQRPFCLVSNHLSYLDALLMQITTESLQIAKSDIASWPLVGWLAARLGTIFIDRTTARDVMRVNDIIRTSLKNNEGVVFFPEGTTSDGSSVGTFKSSLLNYPAEATYPVHYASISYSAPGYDASETVCWWADMTFGAHFFDLLRIPRIEASIIFGPEPVTETDRKKLTSVLQSRVADQFVPVRKHTALRDANSAHESNGARDRTRY